MSCVRRTFLVTVHSKQEMFKQQCTSEDVTAEKMQHKRLSQQTKAVTGMGVELDFYKKKNNKKTHYGNRDGF